MNPTTDCALLRTRNRAARVAGKGDSMKYWPRNRNGSSLSNAVRAIVPLALLPIGMILTGPAPARAQETPASSSRGFCFRPDPTASCDWFPITEFGVALAAQPKSGAAFGRIWNLGLMRNLGDRTALGAMVTITHDNVATVTLSPVGRIRLNPSLALDLAPGVIVHGRPFKSFPLEQPTPDMQISTSTYGKAPGFALDASLSYRDWGVFFVRTSVIPYSEVSRSTFTRIDLPGGGTSWLSGEPETVPQKGVLTEHWVGVRAGSYAGLGLGVLTALATVVASAVIDDN